MEIKKRKAQALLKEKRIKLRKLGKEKRKKLRKSGGKVPKQVNQENSDMYYNVDTPDGTYLEFLCAL